MPKAPAEIGDFGLPKRPQSREQVVGIYDLVSFTDLPSNKQLLEAVRMIEIQLELTLDPEFYWDERARGGIEKEINNILLRSTGDGYVLAFSQGSDDLKALRFLTQIHTAIKKHHAVRLGINKGENYVVTDVNNRVNIVGWGINWAARALQFAEDNQIICTDHFAEPLLKTYDEIDDRMMIDIGAHTVKKARIHFYNYYKGGEFGAPRMESGY